MPRKVRTLFLPIHYKKKNFKCPNSLCHDTTSFIRVRKKNNGPAYFHTFCAWCMTEYTVIEYDAEFEPPLKPLLLTDLMAFALPAKVQLC